MTDMEWIITVSKMNVARGGRVNGIAYLLLHLLHLLLHEQHGCVQANYRGTCA